MSRIIRENINSKIGCALEVFEKLNLNLQNYDEKFFDYYESLRNNIIKVLNEIVDNYTYKKSEPVDQKVLEALRL